MTNMLRPLSLATIAFNMSRKYISIDCSWLSSLYIFLLRRPSNMCVCVFNFDAICPNLYYCFIPLLLRNAHKLLLLQLVIETVIEYIEWIWNETWDEEEEDRERQHDTFAHIS